MLNINDQLDNRYEIVSRIGQGGMSYVYRAVDKKLGREVAIKVLKEEVASNEDFVDRFKNEARAAAKLSHPNIVAVYDIVDSGEIHYIVMELVEGITLKNYILKKGVLSNKETIGIAMQAASGISEAHRNGIIHRDIKPQNIIISKDGKIKVADFGIAVAMSGEQNGSQVVIGSAHYMAPEQAKTGITDVRSDIYSFGISMYEMITGRLPYDGEDTVSIIMAHIQNALIPPQVYNHDIYPALNDIILKALKKDPDERYASCEELSEDLRHAITEPRGHFVRLYNSVGSGELKNAAKEIGDGMGTPGLRKTADGKEAFAGQQTADIGAASGVKAIRDSEAAGERSLRGADKEAPIKKGTGNDEVNSGYNRDNSQDNGKSGKADENAGSLGKKYGEDHENRLGGKKLLLWGGFAAAILALIVFSATVFNNGRRHRAEISAESEREETRTTAETEPTESSTEASMAYTISISGENRMPRLIGRDINDARAKMAELGSTMDSSAEDYSDVYPKGTIIKQNPATGEILSTDTIVYVTISRGSALDDIEGKREEDAVEGLRNAGYAVDELRAQEFSDSVAEGLVCGYRLVDSAGTEFLPEDIMAETGTSGTQPGDTASSEITASGSTEAPADSTIKFRDYSIRLVISRGSVQNYAAVPDLTDMPRLEAEAGLNSLGLRAGLVTALNTDQYPYGYVVSQATAPGEYVKLGGSIDFTVSVGTTGEIADGTDITDLGDMEIESEEETESETTPLLNSDYYYGSIDTFCEIGGVPMGPGSGRDAVVNISIRLMQHVDGADEYTQLLGPLPVNAGSRLPVTFKNIRGSYGVEKGYVEVYNTDTHEVYSRFEISFGPA